MRRILGIHCVCCTVLCITATCMFTPGWLGRENRGDGTCKDMRDMRHGKIHETRTRGMWKSTNVGRTSERRTRSKSYKSRR
ncbi:hypothetical protein EDB19DRAFT_1721932 [Suillus lakei]|nr:hypothetical protein EDB19DRAFT_1721932 [Suillus lakei]